MSKQNITAWFFEGGSVGIPRRLLGLMEPLGLNFEDLGKILYLLYCGTNEIKKQDHYAQEAARTLHSKGLIHWFTDTETVDFSPMFDKISLNLGEQPQYLAEARSGFTSSELNHAQLVKQMEQVKGSFVTINEKTTAEDAVMRYNWSYDLMYEIYKTYYKKYRKEYEFKFFCQMAFGAQVQDKESFLRFDENLNTTNYKTIAVMRRLGQQGYPTEPQKELYFKWTAQWKFTHEMVMRAVEETTSARNPSFKYIDAILEKWLQQDITTPEALKREKQQQAKQKQVEKNLIDSGAKAKAAKQNFKSKERDLSVLEQ